MLVDAERALSSLEVTDLLYGHNSVVLKQHEGLGCISLPTDQRFHSIAKRRYYRNLTSRPNPQTEMTPTEKFEHWRSAFWSVSRPTIRSFFATNGLTSDEDADEVAARMLSEGHRMADKYVPLHQVQLQSYLEWRLDNGLDLKYLKENVHFFRGGPFWEIVTQYI